MKNYCSGGIDVVAAVIKKGRGEYIALQFPESSSDEEPADGRISSAFDALSSFVHISESADEGAENDPAEVNRAEEAPDPVEDAGRQAAGIIEAAERQAADILRRAERESLKRRSEADEILSRARLRAEEESASAYEQGFEQGRKDGEDFGRRQYEARVSRLEKLIDSIRNRADALVGRHERQIVRLVMEIARHVVGREIETAPDVIFDSIKAAMAMVVAGTTVDIHINPEDFDYIGDRWQDYLDGNKGINVKFTQDAAVTRGGCLIETGFGLVDATVEGRMQAVHDEINRVLNERTGVESDKDLYVTGGDGNEPVTDGFEQAGNGPVSRGVDADGAGRDVTP